uniref:Atrial natriuretic peptide receptor 2-like n=1 Tax=Saccoglossus kowalevskii TaxID=10224 RepID=A0ABM0LUC7_SACKO|nr:PREDICTED: atrial natriuretic peptide receptor 2-like [Saccoglossus kowalevskii]
MTIYIDTLKDSQRRMTEIIVFKLEERINVVDTRLGVRIGTMAVVLTMCGIIIKAVEVLTGNTQNYALTLAKQTKALNKERKRVSTILYSLMPKSIARQLMQNSTVTAESFSEATIFLSDIVGFTRICSDSSPMQVVELLNHVYTTFDRRIDLYDVYKVETIGDAYMVVSGIPKPNGKRHASEIAIMSLDMVSCAESLVIPHKPGTKMTLRIGIHTGSVAAGIVGTKMPRYYLFGYSVRIASRMEATGLPNRIHLSEHTRDILKDIDCFVMKQRGEITITGKGRMATYWLLNRRNIGGSAFKQDVQEHLNLNVPDAGPANSQGLI